MLFALRSTADPRIPADPEMAHLRSSALLTRQKKRGREMSNFVEVTVVSITSIVGTESRVCVSKLTKMYSINTWSVYVLTLHQ